MEKLYERQIFKNDDVPALNETNLNILTKAVDDIDNRLKDVIPSDDYIEISNEVKENLTEATREADRAKEEADKAKAIVGIGIATTTQAGIVKPDGHTISVNADGTIVAETDDALSDTSTRAIQTKVVKERTDALDEKIDGVDSLLHESDSTFKFGVDEYGNYGYKKPSEDGADTVIPFNDSSVVFQVGGYNRNSTSWGAMQGEHRKYVNEKLCEWVSVARVKMKVDGIIHAYYSASGNSTTATTAYGGYTAVVRVNEDKTEDWVGASTGNQTRFAMVDAIFEVKAGDEIYATGRGSSGSQYGGYTMLLMYSPTETVPTT